MVAALEFDQIHPDLSLWHAYDGAVKADLFSAAVSTKNGIYLVDPIQLENTALTHLLKRDPVAGVIITNGNHIRTAGEFVRQFSVPFFARRESLPVDSSLDLSPVDDKMRIGDELEVITIEGAGPGEIALYHAANGGTLIMGDALLNFDPYGFTFLPGKYCQNVKQMRDSLEKLLHFETERMLFAHGMPILSGANARLRQLLQSGS